MFHKNIFTLLMKTIKLYKGIQVTEKRTVLEAEAETINYDISFSLFLLRLSTQANLGNLDTVAQTLSMGGANLALTQLQVYHGGS